MKKVLLLLAACGITTSVLAANPRQGEIDNLLNALKTQGAKGKIEAVEPLMWQGISDTKVYDVIAKELKDIYPESAKDKMLSNLSAHYCKALAYSGHTQYQALVEEVTAKGPKKVAKHCNEALPYFAKYKTWNTIINSTNNKMGNPSTSAAARYYNMINSNELELARLGIKRMYNERITDQAMYDLVKTKLLANYQLDTKDKTEIDAIIWMAKVLAETGENKYYDTLKTVADGATNRKIAKKVGKWASAIQ